ncbi:MAG: TIGR04086 family membrane protein [Clostridia bacterium]|nr:TIGR04086 family membrane protein [Clostridia bacterium]
MKGKFGNNPTSIETSVKPLIRGLIIGLVITSMLFILFALAMSFYILPTNSATIVASLSIAVGAFFGGYFAAKKLAKNGLIIGALCGFAMFLLFTLIGIAAFGTAPSTSTLIRLLIFMTSGAIGGIIGVGNADKRKIV